MSVSDAIESCDGLEAEIAEGKCALGAVANYARGCYFENADLRHPQP